jgi:tRNA (cmo5U34)-methyltransferase
MNTSDNATPHKSDEYDISVRQTIPFYETIQTETVDLVRTLKPEVDYWLDTGCGTGYLVEIARPYFPNTTFILTDPSAAMMKEAKDRLINLPESRVKFLSPTPSEDLNAYKDEIHPQVITAVLCHHYLRKPQRVEATQACYDLLDKDDVYITVENIAPRTPQCVSLGLERWKRFQIAQGRTEAVVADHVKRYGSAYFPITMDEHLELLRSAGFKTIEIFWMSHMQAGFYGIK